MINSDRVTSSSDEVNHMITSPSAACRHGDDDDDDDDDDVDSALHYRLSHDKTHQPAVTESPARMFTHLATPPLVRLYFDFHHNNLF